MTDECLYASIKVHTLEVFQKELNESEHLVFQAVHSLQRALQGDYRDVVNMKESSRQRLEALREAAIKVRSAVFHKLRECFYSDELVSQFFKGRENIRVQILFKPFGSPKLKCKKKKTGYNTTDYSLSLDVLNIFLTSSQLCFLV